MLEPPLLRDADATFSMQVIITSGTLSPLDLYPKLLGFDPVVRVALDMSTFRDSVCPIVVTRGDDQGQLSTRFEVARAAA